MDFVKMSMLLFLVYFSTVYAKSFTVDNFCEKNENYGLPCEVDDKPGFCYERKCTLAMQPTPQRILIKIRYPLNNKYAKNASLRYPKMFLRGNRLGLSWKEGKRMIKTQETDTWEYELDFAIPGLDLGSVKAPPPANFDFRVYLDDSKNMLGPNFFLLLPVSTDTKNSNKTPVFINYPWFFNKEGRFMKRLIYSPQLGHPRLVMVYLPPSFYENTYKGYETMVVNDGQRLHFMLPQLGVLMVERALIKEILVIGIQNDYSNRTELLAVSNGSNVECIQGDSLSSCNGCIHCNSAKCGYSQLVEDYRRCYKWVPIPKVYGQLYLDFIQDTVIPECKLSYRALSGAENYGIMGFSLGGLTSCHATWTRPQTFGSAACMSPSLWWPFPENATFPDDAGYEFTTKTLWQQRGARPRQKVYIDVGGEEGHLMVNPAINASKILASSPYFEMNKNLWFYVWNGEHHTFMTSVHRMWIPLIAFYGTEGAPQAEMLKQVEKHINITAMGTGAAKKNTFAFITLFCMFMLSHVV